MSTQTPESSLHPTIDELLEAPPHPIYVVADSRLLGWEGIQLSHANLEPLFEYSGVAPSDSHQLVLTSQGHTHVEMQIDDGSFHSVYATPGALQLLPIHYGVSSRWDLPCAITGIRLMPQIGAHFEDSTFKGDPDNFQLLPTQNFFDPLLRHLVMELRSEVQSPHPLGNLFAESVAHLLMLHLLRRYSTAVIISKSRRTLLSLIQQRTIETYIDDHLAETITLDALARAIHVSVPHFERMFRAAYHRPPYQYVLERRIERAKSLLKDRTLSIYEVARLCGFANQSHFTRHFTRLVNISPAQFASLVRM
jgi:AraC family transcriptional regulator